MYVVSCGWFSWDYNIIDNGTHVTTIHNLSFGGCGYFEIDGHRYEIRRERLKYFSLRNNNVVICDAIKPSVWRNSFRVKLNDKEFVLKQNFFYGHYALLEGSSEIGNISPEGFFFSVTVNLPDRLPMVARIFMASLPIILRMRSRD